MVFSIWNSCWVPEEGVHVHHNVRVEISPALVVLEMRGDTGRYQVVINYKENHVVNVCAFVFEYCAHSRAWNQRIGQSDFDKFETIHRWIVTQAQHHFHTIDSRWNENDEEEHPWLFRKMKMFDQKCTPQTRRHVRRAIDRWIRFRHWRLYARQHMLRRRFNTWKEWYFCPENKGGYMMNRMRQKYH